MYKIIQWKYVKYNNNGGRHWTSTIDLCTLMCTPMHKLTVTHTTWGGPWGRDSHSQGLVVLELVRSSGMLSTSVSSALSLICWEHRCVTSTQLSKQVCFNIMLRKLNINPQREVYINLFIRTNSSEIGFIQLLETLVCFVEGPFVCVPALCMFLTPNKSLSSMADFVCCCLLCFIFLCYYLLSLRVFSLLVLSLAEKNESSFSSKQYV